MGDYGTIVKNNGKRLIHWMRKEVKDRIDDLACFLDKQTEAITEYSETLVRRLIEKITVYDEMLVVEFKSGLQIEVET